MSYPQNIMSYPQRREYSDSGSEYGPATPFKRPKKQDDHTSTFIHMNQKTSQSQLNPQLTKVTGNIFYKTRLCAKHMSGNCSNGEHCTYAHGSEDLHEPPPNWKEYVHANGKGSEDNDRRTNGGMKFCRYFLFEKECPYGERCNFLHTIPNSTEMARPLPAIIYAPSIDSTGRMLKQGNDTAQTRLHKHLTCSEGLLVKKNPACLKTQMCTKWESTGQCPFKGHCRYAHGKDELVTLESAIMSGTIMDRSNSRKNIELPSSSGGPNEAAAPTKFTGANKLLNWRTPRKIIGIYGDWPDGWSLPDNN